MNEIGFCCGDDDDDEMMMRFLSSSTHSNHPPCTVAVQYVRIIPRLYDTSSIFKAKKISPQHRTIIIQYDDDDDDDDDLLMIC